MSKTPMYFHVFLVNFHKLIPLLYYILTLSNVSNQITGLIQHLIIDNFLHSINRKNP